MATIDHIIDISELREDHDESSYESSVPDPELTETIEMSLEETSNQLFLKKLRYAFGIMSKLFILFYIGYLVFINYVVPLIILKGSKTCSVHPLNSRYISTEQRFEAWIMFLATIEVIMRAIINQGQDLVHIWYSSHTYFEHILFVFKIILTYHYSVYVINHWDHCDIFIQIQQVSKLSILSMDLLYKLLFKKKSIPNTEDLGVLGQDMLEPVEPTEEPPRRTVIPNYSFHRIYLGKECVVCLEAYDYNSDDVIALACGHVFHIQCVAEQEDCPVCRLHMPLEEIINEDNKEPGNNPDSIV
jgi:hypothetical protein